MIFFFWKHQQFVQCEIHPGRPHVFRLIDSGGEEHTERYRLGRPTSRSAGVR